MSPNRLAVVCILLVGLHFFGMFIAWFEARLRPAFLKIGLLNQETEYLYQVAVVYHKMGILVPSYLLVPPSFIPMAEARLLKKRLVIEFIAISIGALIPSGVFIATTSA